jgi:predicted 2-oxoglutarate/Fe(II)-dependent dioxygenase YbiX
MQAMAEALTAAPFHPLPGGSPLCVVVPGFLSPAECRRQIALSEARGFAGAGTDYPPSYRDNDRQVLDDPAFARDMFARLAPHAPATLARDDGTWALDAVNERFRFCRYRPGQQFRLHQDGVHHRDEGLQSCLTFMVYLTDGDDFAGGDTLFHSAGPGGDPRITGRVRPRAGSLILFDHALWHAGEAVTAGVKHILRSDVLYRRAPRVDVPAGPFHPAHRGYVWTMERLTPDLLASGGRDATIRLWTEAGEARGQLNGHTRSVLGLASLPDGRLASVSRDRTLRIWSVPQRRCTREVIAHDAAALAVCALPGGRLATAGADGAVKLWRDDGEPLGTLGLHGGWAWALAPLGDDRLASASEDGLVKVWDLSSGRCLQTLPGDAPLRALTASPDGQQLSTGDLHGRIATWQRDGDAWRAQRAWPAHTAAVRRLRHAGGVLASTGEDNALRLWRDTDGALQAGSRHDNFVTDALDVRAGWLGCSYDGRMLCHALDTGPTP